MNRFVFLFFLLCSVVAGAGIQNMRAADSAGSVNGKVFDGSGSAVAGAKVTIRNLETDSMQQSVTDSGGGYKAENLPLGRYSVTAELKNGVTVALNSVQIMVNAASSTAVAATAAAQITATVIVNAQAPLVEKEMSQLDKTVNTKAILELPGRLSFSRLALLQNGVVPNTDPLFGNSYSGIVSGLNYSQFSIGALNPVFGSPFAVNGTRPNANYFTIDGSYNEDPIRATNRQSMPPEAMQTFELINGNFPAQIGRYGGSYLDQVSRAGNTGIHGTATYTYGGNFMNALSSDQRRTAEGFENFGASNGSAFDIATPVIVNNRAAASAGFPIWKDKVFSFSSWDRDWFSGTFNPTTIGITPLGFGNLVANSNLLAPGQLRGLVSTFPVATLLCLWDRLIYCCPTELWLVNSCRFHWANSTAELMEDRLMSEITGGCCSVLR